MSLNSRRFSLQFKSARVGSRFLVLQTKKGSPPIEKDGKPPVTRHLFLKPAALQGISR